ncbi:hypothetical protein N8600_04480 [Gammaproteobacteria bacterium]|nr:hypothetical protein [Gammaproteobacteria bacterium]
MKTHRQQEIEALQELRQSLLSEETVMWDEVYAVERDLKFLLGTEELSQETPYAAEDAAVAMMESAARKAKSRANDEANKSWWNALKNRSKHSS